MASKKTMMFIDTSKCIGCKACQVACKQWHSLPAEETTFTGSYTNPPDVSGNTLTFVKFRSLKTWQNFTSCCSRRQCMHCNQAECQSNVRRELEKQERVLLFLTTIALLANLRGLGLPAGATDEEIIARYIELCPYRIPRFTKPEFVKCDFCFNRFRAATAVRIIPLTGMATLLPPVNLRVRQGLSTGSTTNIMACQEETL